MTSDRPPAPAPSALYPPIEFHRTRTKLKIKACEVLPVVDHSFSARSAIGSGCGATTTQPQQPSAEELAKQSQNPIANLISVPLQNNFYFGTGSKNRTVYAGNLRAGDSDSYYRKLESDYAHHLADYQPTIAVSWHEQCDGTRRHKPDVFLSPAKPGELIWGAGPTFTLPTATDSLLGNGKFSMGPAAVAVDNTRTLAFWGADEQPVVGRRLGPEERKRVPASAVRELQSSRRLVFDERTDHDGQLESRQGGRCVDGSARWRCGQTVQNRQLPIDTQLQAFGNVAKPNGPDWQLRFQIKLLFPE